MLKRAALTLSLIFLAILVLILRGCITSNTETKIYYIARDTTWYPANLWRKQQNVLAFSNDLLLAIGKEENINFITISTTSESLLPGLNNESYDGILSFLDQTSSSQMYLFSDPAFLIGPVIVVRADFFEKTHGSSDKLTLDDLKGKVIAIPTSPPLNFNKGNNVNLFLTPYENPTVALEDLAKNSVDGVLLDDIRAYAYTQSFYAGILKVATKPLNQQGLRLITRRDSSNQKLIEHFNEGLKKIRKNGVYEELLKKWELFNPE